MALKVFSNDEYTVIAEDFDDARKVLVEIYGSVGDEYAEGEWEAYPDDRVIRIHDNEGDLRERGFVSVEIPLGHEVVARTAAEWIASEGRGVLCSRNY